MPIPAWIFRGLLPLLIIILGSGAAYSTIKDAVADHLSWADSLAGRRTAAALTPGNAAVWIRLAHLQQQQGVDALPAYTRASQASPLDANAWIGMGLEQELAGNMGSAERNLLHAVGISQEYVPRWTLLNFYFRRNDAVNFRVWAKQALAIGIGDQQAVFRMAWALSDNADQISEAIPDRALLLNQYLSWLIAAEKIEPAAKIFSRLIRVAGPAELPGLLYFCNAQLTHGNFSAAKAAWTEMTSRGLLPATANSADSGLVNAHFAGAPLNSGLDWRFPTLGGVLVRPTLPGLRVKFSGKEPESCELLSQYVELQASRKYDLACEYQTSGITSDKGLSWRIFDLKTGQEFTKDPPGLGRDNLAWQSQTFVTPPGTAAGRLALIYRRAPGTTRIEGWIQLNQVALRAAQ